MKYVPGRKLEVTTGKKGKAICLREERISGIPHSFKRLDSFLKDKRRDLKDYVRETSEYGAKKMNYLQVLLSATHRKASLKLYKCKVKPPVSSFTS